MAVFFIIGAVCLCVLLFSRYAYRMAFFVKANHQKDPYDLLEGEQYQQLADSIYSSTRRMEIVPYEAVSITTRDGLTLTGRYYHFRDDAPVEILMHGYRSCALRDCSGGHYLAEKMGFNVLVVDQRAHGTSEGSVITFGVKERYDLLEWIQFVNGRLKTPQPIILSGLSMGAATVLAASELDLPENVVAVMADSPYTSPKEIICKVCADEKLPPKLAWPFVYLGACLYGHFSPTESSALEAVSRARVPIHLIHGEDDRFVPCDMSRALKAACASPCRLDTFPDAGHGLSYMVDPWGYEKAVYEFLGTFPALHGRIEGTPLEKEP